MTVQCCVDISGIFQIQETDYDERDATESSKFSEEQCLLTVTDFVMCLWHTIHRSYQQYFFWCTPSDPCIIDHLRLVTGGNRQRNKEQCFSQECVFPKVSNLNISPCILDQTIYFIKQQSYQLSKMLKELWLSCLILKGI